MVVQAQRVEGRNFVVVVVRVEMGGEKVAKLDQRVEAVVIQVADEFEVATDTLAEHDAVSLLCDEETERETEVCIQQSLSQSVG